MAGIFFVQAFCSAFMGLGAAGQLAAAGIDFQDLVHGFVQVELAPCGSRP